MYNNVNPLLPFDTAFKQHKGTCFKVFLPNADKSPLFLNKYFMVWRGGLLALLPFSFPLVPSLMLSFPLPTRAPLASPVLQPLAENDGGGCSVLGVLWFGFFFPQQLNDVAEPGALVGCV